MTGTTVGTRRHRCRKPTQADESRPYLRLLGRVGVVLLCLIYTATLRLGRGGGACRRLGCYQCLEARCYGWGEGVLWWCYPPWKGYQLWTEISCRKISPQYPKVCPPYPLPPLQCLAETLVELLLYQAKEGGREGGFLVGLRPHPQADPGCLFQEEKISSVVGWTPSYPSKTVQKMAQASSWDAASSQPAMGANFCLPIKGLVSAKEVRVPPPKTASHFCMRSAASNPDKG